MMTKEKRFKRKIRKALGKSPKSTLELLTALKIKGKSDSIFLVDLVHEMMLNGEVVPTQDGRVDLWRVK